jgi:putative peptidoglycan lipid II flippase
MYKSRFCKKAKIKGVNSMKKTAITLMLITILSKIFGFAREITLSYFYGASNISDAYLISLTIPAVIFAFIGTGIATSYIPMYSYIEQIDGVENGNKYTNNLINTLFILCTIIIILGFIFTEQIVKVFASGFEGETLKLAIQFTKISLLGIYSTGIIYIFSAFLQLKGNYVIPALVGFPMNFLFILSILLSSNTNILVLSIGSVIAISSQLILLVPFVHRKGYNYKFIIDFKNDYIIKMMQIALPVIIGVSIYQINVLVDRTMASGIAVGGISALNYSNKINGFVQGIFVLSISTAMYPLISKMAAEKDMLGLKKSISEAISGISLLVIPAIIGSMIFSKPIVELLFGRGAFDAQAITMTSYTLFYYSIGMIGYGLKEVLAKTFYSLQDTKTPMINAAISLIINIVLNVILSRFLGIGGLALATSISVILCTVLLFISLRKKIGSFGMRSISISLIKILCASLVMGLVAKLSFNYLISTISQNLSLLLSIGIGALIYFTIIYFMKIDDVDVIVNIIKRKMRRT